MGVLFYWRILDVFFSILEVKVVLGFYLIFKILVTCLRIKHRCIEILVFVYLKFFCACSLESNVWLHFFQKKVCDNSNLLLN
jgi:hypothetical protein